MLYYVVSNHISEGTSDYKLARTFHFAALGEHWNCLPIVLQRTGSRTKLPINKNEIYDATNHLEFDRILPACRLLHTPELLTIAEEIGSSSCSTSGC